LGKAKGKGERGEPTSPGWQRERKKNPNSSGKKKRHFKHKREDFPPRGGKKSHRRGKILATIPTEEKNTLLYLREREGTNISSIGGTGKKKKDPAALL